jgi:hypothetical protein
VIAMPIKKLLCPERVRKIQGSFSWIEHRFITGGFLWDLSTVEILLYFFLVAVSDRNGLSFYHDDRIASLLKIDLASLGKAREGLILRSLLAYEPPLYQILSLPPEPVIPPTKEERATREHEKALHFFKTIQEVLK